MVDQHIGAFEVGAADLQVVPWFPGAGQCGDDIGPAILEAGDHVGNATGALHFETQPGAQANEFQQVGGDASEMPRIIEIGQWCSRVIGCHAHHGMLLQPLLLGRAQLQLAIAQQQVAAGAPAFEDTGAYGRALPVQDGVHQVQQHGILLTQGKTEADGLVFAEVGHAQAGQMTTVELVVRGDGVADEHVGLAECDSIQCLAGRTKGQQLGLGVGGEYFLSGQIVVEHTQAHAGKVHVQCPVFVFTRYQYRLVDGIGARQCQAVTGRFVAIGAAQQVDIPVPEPPPPPAGWRNAAPSLATARPCRSGLHTRRSGPGSRCRHR